MTEVTNTQASSDDDFTIIRQTKVYDPQVLGPIPFTSFTTTSTGNTQASSDDDFTLVSNTDIASSSSFSLGTHYIFDDKIVNTGNLAGMRLVVGLNDGRYTTISPDGFIYGTPAMHGLTLEEIHVHIPSLTTVSTGSGSIATFSGGSWIGSLSGELSIFIPEGHPSFASMSPWLDASYDVPSEGYEIYAMIVSDIEDTHLFSRAAPSMTDFTVITNTKV